MGSNQSTATQESGTNHYERFGDVIVKERYQNTHEGEDKISEMIFSRSIESENIIKEWQQQINRVDDSETREVLLIPEKHEFEKSGMCGSSGIVKLTYENFPFVLDVEIQNRKRLGSYFLETEMWYLLYNFIRAGNKFEKIGKKIGDMNPKNVIINDDGMIKVISTCSLPNETTNFDKVVENINEEVFLAPEELNYDAISKGEYPSNVDPCRAEVFSIGLTVLSSGILEDCHSIYLSGYRGINEKLLAEYLSAFKQRYSNYLFTTVASLLALNPRDRRKSSEIYRELYPSEQKILDLEEFFDPGASRFQGNDAPRYGYQSTKHPVNSNVIIAQPVRSTYGVPQNINYTGQGNWQNY